MDESNPETWYSPEWHADWDGDWQFEQLREFTRCFLQLASESHHAKLEIIDEGFVHVAFYDGERCLGAVYVNRARAHPDPTPAYTVYFGSADDELSTNSTSAAIRCLLQAQGHWDHDVEK